MLILCVITQPGYVRSICIRNKIYENLYNDENNDDDYNEMIIMMIINDHSDYKCIAIFNTKT